MQMHLISCENIINVSVFIAITKADLIHSAAQIQTVAHSTESNFVYASIFFI